MAGDAFAPADGLALTLQRVHGVNEAESCLLDSAEICIASKASIETGFACS